MNSNYTPKDVSKGTYANKNDMNVNTSTELFSNKAQEHIVLKRLEDVVQAHEVSLSRISTTMTKHRQGAPNESIERKSRGAESSTSTSSSSTIFPSTSEQHVEKITIAEAARQRSYASKSPFGENTITEIELNPPERAKPQDLLQDMNIHDHDNETPPDLQHKNIHMDMNTEIYDSPSSSSSVKHTTIKAITVMATLCEEAKELHTIALRKFLPQLHLFCHDLKLDANSSNIGMTGLNMSTSMESDMDVQRIRTKANDNGMGELELDEQLMIERDKELLKRIGAFMVVLQNIYNLITRCQHLIKNMICQIHGCLNPMHSSLFCAEDRDADTEESMSLGLRSAGMHSALTEPPLFGSVRNITPIVEAITELLEVLISVDTIVSNNPELAEAWDLYKAVVMDDDDMDGSDEADDAEQGPVSFVDIQLQNEGLLASNGIRMNNGEEEDDVSIDKEKGDDRKDNVHGGPTSVSASALSPTQSKLEQHILPNPDTGTDQENEEEEFLEKSKELDPADESSSKVEGASLPPHPRREIALLRQMLMQLDFTLFSSRSFLIAIEQNFDPTNEIFMVHNANQDERGNGNGQDNGYGDRERKQHSSGVTLHVHLKQSIEFLYEKCCSDIIIATTDSVASGKNDSRHRHGSTQVNADRFGHRGGHMQGYGCGHKPVSVERVRTVGVYGLYCLYRRLLPANIAPDEKLHRSLCNLLPSKRPMIPLFGALPFFPAEFLSRYAPLDGVKRVAVSDIDGVRATATKILLKQDKAFSKDVSILFRKVLTWIVEADSALAPTLSSADTNETINLRSTVNEFGEHLDLNEDSASPITPIAYKLQLVQRGIDFGHHATKLLSNHLAMHKNLMVPIPSGHLQDIEKLCSMAKSIEIILRKSRRDCVVAIYRSSQKLIGSWIFRALDKLRSHIDHNDSSLRNTDDFAMKRETVRIGTCLSILESLLKGSSSFSLTRLYTTKVALHACCANYPDVSNKLDMIEVEDLLCQLELLCDDKLGFEACDCSFLYFHKALFVPLLKYTFNSSTKSNLSRMHLFSALSDPSNSFLPASAYLKRIYKRPLYVDKYLSHLIENVLFKEVIYPLAENIESLLRHRIHTRNIDEMPMINPKDRTVNNFMKLLDLPPINICGMMFSIKIAVEKVLEKSLYNSSTVGLKDTNIHIEMATLATTYGLNLIDSHLPAGTADQGMDIIEIINDLEGFFSRFNYNMNQQNFVERVPVDGRRYVQSVDIKCLSMALSRHGFGITNLVTQSIYDYISKSLNGLMNLLSQETFHSAMAKENRWFEEQMKRGASFYSFERALSFKNELVHLSGSEKTQSLLHEAKTRISKIGNALGLTRLLRSAKMYHNNRSRQFITTKLKPASLNSNQCHDSINESVHMLKSLLETPPIETSFFPQEVQISSIYDKRDPFDLVHIIYPSLSLLWLDASGSGKEMLRKKIKPSEGYFSDDGFALGFAYLFEVVNPRHGKIFDGMKWYEASRQKFAQDKSEMKLKAESIRESLDHDQNISSFTFLADQSDAIIDDDNEYTRLQVLAKRLETRRIEMESLHFSLHASRVMLTCT